MAKFVNDPQFKLFAGSLQQVIMGYGSTDEDFTDRQKRQVETLVKLEKQFKKVLQADSRGKIIYKAFINYILKERGNTLAARPFFRERQEFFAKGISPAIKSQNPKRLYKFDVNYAFINFVLQAHPWGVRSKVRKSAEAVWKMREEIVHMNMPLAISRARIFREKTPESHLDYMDLVQISFEGLINAVDKFVLPYTPVFRSVIIGRITGDLIESFSDTMIHFYPSDKRKIYRANKARKHQRDVNYDNLASAVNSGIKLNTPTNSAEIQQLVAASSSHTSIHHSEDPETESDNISEKYAATDDSRPDTMFESQELRKVLRSCITDLSALEKKFLKLKGIDLGENNDEYSA